MEGSTKIKGLYTIIDTSYVSLEDIKRVTEEIIHAGGKIIQLRAKETASGDILRAALTIREITRACGALFLMNDRIDIALMTQADGVHIGNNDLPPQEARALLKAGKIIGCSTHTTQEAEAAEELGAQNIIDYISCGPIFPTKTKKDAHPIVGLEGLKKTREKTSLPIVAIGGITEENLPEVLRAGADGVAIISELMQTDVSKIAAKTEAIINIMKTS